MEQNQIDYLAKVSLTLLKISSKGMIIPAFFMETLGSYDRNVVVQLRECVKEQAMTDGETQEVATELATVVYNTIVKEYRDRVYAQYDPFKIDYFMDKEEILRIQSIMNTPNFAGEEEVLDVISIPFNHGGDYYCIDLELKGGEYASFDLSLFLIEERDGKSEYIRIPSSAAFAKRKVNTTYTFYRKYTEQHFHLYIFEKGIFG